MQKRLIFHRWQTPNNWKYLSEHSVSHRSSWTGFVWANFLSFNEGWEVRFLQELWGWHYFGSLSTFLFEVVRFPRVTKATAQAAPPPTKASSGQGWHLRPVHRFQCSCPTVSSSFTPSSMALVNLPTASHFCSLWGKNMRRWVLDFTIKHPNSMRCKEKSPCGQGSSHQTWPQVLVSCFITTAL